MAKPTAVLISDVHFSIPTLDLATKALTQAVDKANDLRVPLIIAGDAHDTKANLRGECVKAILETLHGSNEAYVLVGNHDRINEKSTEHSLEFLQYMGNVDVVNTHTTVRGQHLIPYHHDLDELRKVLATIPKGSTIIMHQGVTSATSEGYPGDKTAIEASAVAGQRVISGHYHRRQDIELPDGGKWSYLGNPYTLNYGEANEPEKGFQVLYDDGSLEFVPTKLRKHVVIPLVAMPDGLHSYVAHLPVLPGDIVKVTVSGPAQYVAKWPKDKLADYLKLPESFRLDLIPDAVEATAEQEKVDTLSQADLLDSMIDSIGQPRLKDLWKGLLK